MKNLVENALFLYKNIFLIIQNNEDIKKEKIDMTLTIDFSQKVKATSDIASHSSLVNIGLFYPSENLSRFANRGFFRTGY